MRGRLPKGLTLIELLIVVAILAILLILSMISWRVQIAKARDTQRKDEVQRLKTAFEEYFSDQECYPPAAILDNCLGPELKPYLDKIPCDPSTDTPYLYMVDADNPACPKNFRILANLDNDTDPVIANLNCEGAEACGWGANYNYGVSSGNVAVSSQTIPPPSASPAANPTYYCQSQLNCSEIPAGITCSPSYSDPFCGNSNNCANTVSNCN